MIPLRLYLYAAGALAIVGLLWYTVHAIDQGGYNRAQAEYTKAMDQLKAEHQQELLQRDLQSEEASNGHQQELSRLRGARPSRVVRVCDASAGGNQVRDAQAPGGSPDGSATGGLLPQGDGSRDIGPGLYAIADDADECSAKVRALQDWIKRQIAVTTSSSPASSTAVRKPART